MLTEYLLKVDFTNTQRCALKNPCPALMCFDKWVFRLANWHEFVQIFYYLIYQTEEGKQKIDECVNKHVTSANIKIISDNDNPGFILNPTKFSKKLYARVSDSTFMHNLLFVEQLYCIAQKYDFQLWLREQGCDEYEVGQQISHQITSLTKKSQPNIKKEKSTKYFIARINGECLTDAEKLFLRIEREFDKYILLGDIVLSEDEELLLKQYMTYEIKRLSLFRGWSPKRDKVFALGLVRFAMKHYSQRTFWVYTQDEFGVTLDGNKQNVVHDTFRGIMHQYGKTYDDTLAQKIDNISLHSFVTDKCASQFFDYLFAFWRIDLSRNIQNLYGKVGGDNFQILIDELKSNNSVGVQNVMKHTSMALALNEKSCKLRIRRILKLMDDCFWNQTQIPCTGNRINELLRRWMDDSKGNFQREYKLNIRKKGTKGELLLSKPTMRVDFNTSTFILRMPRQILLHCKSDESPIWTVTAENGNFVQVEPTLLQGQRIYTEEVNIELPREFLFAKLKLVLASDTTKYYSNTLKAESFRFFNANGNYVDHASSLPAGTLFCYSEDCHVPQILYKQTTTSTIVNNMYVVQYQTEKGDILRLPNGHAVQVGEKLAEGLSGGLIIDGVVAHENDVAYSVYATLPKIVFKSEKKNVEGAGVIINGSKAIIRLVDRLYYEFKLDDTLDDIYAYAIDLNDYVTEEGCYTISISVPNNRSQNTYRFCYLRNFDYQFESAPYVFAESGSIRFDRSLNVDIDRDNWENLGAYNRLTFNFDPNSDNYSEKIHDNELYVNYKLKQTLLQLRIIMPILQWKYSKQDDWSYKQPADISRNKVPNYLYVRGPFKFGEKDSCKVYVDTDYDTNLGEEAEIYGQSVKDEDCYCFHLANLKSWFTHDVMRRGVSICLNNRKYGLFDVLCRSIIKSQNLSGDFDKNVLYGYFDIVGDSEYSVDVKLNDEFIGREIPLINGEFALETILRYDTYTVVVYEVEEDDSGFDSYAIELGTFRQKIVNVCDLADSTIYIQDIQDINKQYKPFGAQNKYCIERLERLSYEDLMTDGEEIVGLWSIDISDDEQRANCVFYKGILGYYRDDEFGVGFKTLVIFYSIHDVNKVIILRREDGEYYELLYDRSRDWLIRNDNKYSKLEKLRNLVVLCDDKYRCRIKIEKN